MVKHASYKETYTWLWKDWSAPANLVSPATTSTMGLLTRIHLKWPIYYVNLVHSITAGCAWLSYQHSSFQLIQNWIFGTSKLLFGPKYSKKQPVKSAPQVELHHTGKSPLQAESTHMLPIFDLNPSVSDSWYVDMLGSACVQWPESGRPASQLFSILATFHYQLHQTGTIFKSRSSFSIVFGPDELDGDSQKLGRS